MSETVKCALNNIRTLRAIAKEVDLEWLEDARSKLDSVIASKKEEEELKQMEEKETQDKLKQVKALLVSLGLPETYINDGAEQTKENKSKTVLPAKYKITDEKGNEVKWTGRGRTPLIFKEKIAQGHSMEEFLINP